MEMYRAQHWDVLHGTMRKGTRMRWVQVHSTPHVYVQGHKREISTPQQSNDTLWNSTMEQWVRIHVTACATTQKSNYTDTTWSLPVDNTEITKVQQGVVLWHLMVWYNGKMGKNVWHVQRTTRRQCNNTTRRLQGHNMEMYQYGDARDQPRHVDDVNSDVDGFRSQFLFLHHHLAVAERVGLVEGEAVHSRRALAQSEVSTRLKHTVQSHYYTTETHRTVASLHDWNIPYSLITT